MNCPTCGKPAIPQGQGYWSCGDHIPSRDQQFAEAYRRECAKGRWPTVTRIPDAGPGEPSKGQSRASYMDECGYTRRDK